MMTQIELSLDASSTTFGASPSVVGRFIPSNAGPFEIGFAIGREHARFGLVPPHDYMCPGHPVRQGWQVNRCRLRVLRHPSAGVREWLQLRLQAWRENITFDEVRVTPKYLSQLAVGRCPVTRSLAHQDSLVTARLNPHAAWAAGNLALLSQRAANALDWLNASAVSCPFRKTQAQALTQETAVSRSPPANVPCQEPPSVHSKLSEDEWDRLTSLMSLVPPLPHEEASQCSMRTLPPPRIQVLNPIQGLQAWLTLLPASPDASKCATAFASCLPSPFRTDFHVFFNTLLPYGWRCHPAQRHTTALEVLEDAWRDDRLNRRWQRFAKRLDAESAEHLLGCAVRIGLPGRHIHQHSLAVATECWSLHPAYHPLIKTTSKGSAGPPLPEDVEPC